jgi:hypothetical protein
VKNRPKKKVKLEGDQSIKSKKKERCKEVKGNEGEKNVRCPKSIQTGGSASGGLVLILDVYLGALTAMAERAIYEQEGQSWPTF